MTRSLHVRVAVIAVAIMALTLIIAAFLTQRLIVLDYRQELDRVLKQELDEVRLGLPAELAAAAGADGRTDSAEADLAAQRYLAVHPGSDRHLTMIEIGTRRLSTQDGPPELAALEPGALPTGTLGSLTTAESASGPLRLLSASIVLGPGNDATQLGTVTVLGSLGPGRAAANQALLRIAAAGTVGLALGGLVLFFAVRRALQPVRALTVAARSVDLRDLDAHVPEPDRPQEVKVMAHEFNRMLDRISRGEQQRRQLLSAISHELRTPLAVARGHLEMLETLGERPGYTAVDTAAVVRRELDRLGRIVDDLTAINRGDLAGETASEPIFAPDVLETLRDRVAGLDLDEVAIAEGPPVVLLGDEDRLTQALLNLVVNARTHTPAGTPVAVEAHAADGHIVFSVQDSGPGIDPDVLPDVFEPFVTTKPSGGSRTSGLGLSVVRSVTEAQGGSVDLASGTDGTTVTLTFPLDEESADLPT